MSYPGISLQEIENQLRGIADRAARGQIPVSTSLTTGVAGELTTLAERIAEVIRSQHRFVPRPI